MYKLSERLYYDILAPEILHSICVVNEYVKVNTHESQYSLRHAILFHGPSNYIRYNEVGFNIHKVNGKHFNVASTIKN